MRLTLRTMLAYLDDILEPADAQEIGRKVRDSEFASGLVHRIRSCMRRMRLGAPRLEGKGMGLDPNTVAEYLDNTLPQDRVPDFEKVCLESDVHLAEVASCHQILALVLGEPAEVNPTLRERMYKVGQQVAEPAAPPNGSVSDAVSMVTIAAPGMDIVTESTPPEINRAEAPVEQDLPAVAAVDPGAVQVTSHEDTGRRKHEVPEYLRVQRGVRFWPMVLTAVVAFLIALLALRFLGPFDRNHPVLGALLGSAEAEGEPVEVAQADLTGKAAAPPRSARSEPEDNSRSTEPTGTAEDETAEDQDASDQDDPQPAPETTERPSQQPTAPNETDEPERTGDEPSPQDAARTAGTNGGPSRPAFGTGRAPAVEADEVFEQTLVGSPTTDGEMTAPAGAAEAANTAAAGSTAPAAGAVENQGVGRYISELQVLVRNNPQTELYGRVPTHGALKPGDRLIALPAFRPQLLLASGIQLTLSGPAEIELLTPANDGTPAVAVHSGRVVLMTVGQPGARVYLDLGGRQGLITFVDAQSTVAVEVRGYLPPGSDPEGVKPQNVVEIFAMGGPIEWEEADRPPISLQANEVGALLENKTADIAGLATLPDWISGADLTYPERNGVETLGPLLLPDRAIGLSLAEAANHRRFEVRHLAVRGLTWLGEYDTVVQALNNAQHRAAWSNYFQVLRRQLTRSPEEAREIRVVFERLFPDEAAQLFRMLWGYSPEQLQEGDAAELVDSLEHDLLAVRVLAIENLSWITGGKTKLYSPDHTAERRKSSVREWRQALERGEIVYATPPSPLPESSAPASTARPAPARGGTPTTGLLGEPSRR